MRRLTHLWASVSNPGRRSRPTPGAIQSAAQRPQASPRRVLMPVWIATVATLRATVTLTIASPIPTQLALGLSLPG